MTPEQLLAADTEARQAALDPTRSFIIDAPAGAGKTELLTQRFLVLLSRVDEPEEIIALTFTNKAAAEMQERIMSSLRSATRPLSSTAPPHKVVTYQLACAVLERNAERNWQLLSQPGRLRVMTLDSLSARLARQMPLLSRFGTQPAIATESTRLYEQAAQNTLDQLEDGTSDSDTIAEALAYFDNDAGRLQRMLVSMLARRDQWSKYAFSSDLTNLQADVSQTLRAMVHNELSLIAINISASRQLSFMAAARHAASQSPDSSISLLADWHTPLDDNPDLLPQWRALGELFLTKEGELRKAYRAPINLAGKANAEQKQVLMDAIADFAITGDGASLAAIRKLPDPQLSTDDTQVVTHLAALLRLAYAQLWLVFIREKAVDFSEIAARALLALGDSDDPTELSEHLDYRISHLLIDEFQDTSPQQLDLLKRLTAGWSHDASRTLFLVGDPMQSIYRFRKADVGLFLTVRQQGLGYLKPDRLQLYLNNRSYANVVAWVNDVFPKVFSEHDDPMRGAVTYAPAVARNPLHPQAGVTIHPIISGERDDDSGEETPRAQADTREAETMLRIIREAQQQHPEGSIAVLVRARSHLDALVKQLQAREPRIAFQAVEIDALAARQSVQDLVSLTRALYHRADRVHWLAILRAPWCGLKLEDLHALAADDHQQTLWSLMQDDARINRLSEDGRTRLLPLRQVLADAYRNQGLQRPRRWVEGVWRGLGGPRCLTATADTRDVQAYFDLLDTLEDRGQPDLSRLDSALTKLFAAPDAEPASQHVQLMTIHKSKGLQFDTVILPGLHKTPPPDNTPLVLWDNLILDDQQEHLVVAPAPAPGTQKGNTPTAYDLLQSLEKLRGRNEDQRVLYVAVTRTVRHLHLLAIAQRDTKQTDDPSALREPAAGSLLLPLWPALCGDFLAAATLPAPTLPATHRVDPASFIPKLIRVATPAALAVPSDSEISVPSEQPAHIFPATIDMDTGTLIHRYLEAFAVDGLNHWHAARIQSLAPQFERFFREQGHDPDDITAAVGIVQDTLCHALSHEIGQWVLGPHESAGCEVPLTTLNEDSHDNDDDYQRLVIDRTFIDQGIRWIVDYKTLRISTSQTQTLEAILQSKADSYKPQLQRYAALYRDEGREIRTAIFFPAHGKLIDV